jgi:DNA mismatch repair protein MutS
LSALHQLITLTNPKEIILHKTSPHIRELADSLKTQPHTVVAYRDMLDESESFTLSLLRVQSLASFGKALTEGRVIPFALLLSYLISTQQKTITTIYRVSYYHPDDYVLLDEVTMKNLELFASSYDHDQTYSLFGTLDQCQSISGSKLLKHIIAHPSKNMSLINERLAHIASWIQDYDQAVQITKLIGSLHDIPRLLTTLIYKTPSYVPFVRLRTTLQTILYSGEGNGCQEALLSIDKDVKINTLTDLCDRLDAALRSADDLAPNAEEYIRDGYDAQIDELRTLIHHTDQILL